jgi:hypothetical protein
MHHRKEAADERQHKQKNHMTRDCWM